MRSIFALLVLTQTVAPNGSSTWAARNAAPQVCVTSSPLDAHFIRGLKAAFRARLDRVGIVTSACEVSPSEPPTWRVVVRLDQTGAPTGQVAMTGENMPEKTQVALRGQRRAQAAQIIALTVTEFLRPVWQAKLAESEPVLQPEPDPKPLSELRVESPSPPPGWRLSSVSGHGGPVLGTGDPVLVAGAGRLGLWWATPSPSLLITGRLDFAVLVEAQREAIRIRGERYVAVLGIARQLGPVRAALLAGGRLNTIRLRAESELRGGRTQLHLGVGLGLGFEAHLFSVGQLEIGVGVDLWFWGVTRRFFYKGTVVQAQSVFEAIVGPQFGWRL